MYLLTYQSMWYWYERALWLDSLNMKHEATIRSYQNVTGIYGDNEELMQQNYDLKIGQCKDCVPELEDCSSSLAIYKPRSKRRGIIIAVGIPVALVGGYYAGKYVENISR